jgi:hypothetical protein
MKPYKILVPSGCLGYPCPDKALRRGMGLRPDAIAVDAGSTDSGPYYLGSATSRMTRKAIKRDLRQLMLARDELGIPLLIGSCGTSGTDAGVDWTADICAEIAREDGLRAKVALIYSEQSAETLKAVRAQGRIAALPPLGELTDETLDSCDHIVALLGYEPFAKAVADGADIVLAGRATDTAVLAAMALDAGLPAGPAWHAAKTAECGGLCTIGGSQAGVMISVDAEGFEVEPLSASSQCTPYSVSAHLLYENADPYRLKEPGVLIDASRSVYRSLDERTVRVTGTVAEAMPYTMKLEGSGRLGFRTMAFVAMSDPKLMADPGPWLDQLADSLRRRIESTLGYGPDDYDTDFRPYGWNALDQSAHAGDAPPPREIGLMLIVSAATQDQASEIAKFCSPALLHFPLSREAPMPSWALPFSPAEVEMGPYYEFRLNHVVHIDDPMQLVRMKTLTVGSDVAHASA